jgi:hypothetical protein
MFVPLAVLAQNESMLYTPSDLILALDRWVLPKYPEHTTGNPAMTKLECMGVLSSFHEAGKFHLSLKPLEVEQAVDAFMEDRLWVSRSVTETLILLPNQRPESWMSKPTFVRILRAMWAVSTEWFFTLFHLAKAFVVYSWYAKQEPREVVVPNPTERPLASVMPFKKDS